MEDQDISEAQRDICERFRTDPVAAPADLKVGIARNVREGVAPINGLRHQPTGDTTGWYIWAGDEPSDDPDYFVPLHVSHLSDWAAEVLPYLALPAGWRFQIANDHEDVWKDDTLLED